MLMNNTAIGENIAIGILSRDQRRPNTTFLNGAGLNGEVKVILVGNGSIRENRYYHKTQTRTDTAVLYGQRCLLPDGLYWIEKS